MSEYEPIGSDVEALATSVVNAAFRVHKALGPGLLESVYETCVKHELSKLDIVCESQVSVPVIYDNIQLDAALRLDLWIERKIIVELKAVEKVLPIHKAQLLSYLKLTQNRLGFLINFNVPVIKNGINRIII